MYTTVITSIQAYMLVIFAAINKLTVMPVSSHGFGVTLLLNGAKNKLNVVFVVSPLLKLNGVGSGEQPGDGGTFKIQHVCRPIRPIDVKQKFKIRTQIH